MAYYKFTNFLFTFFIFRASCVKTTNIKCSTIYSFIFTTYNKKFKQKLKIQSIWVIKMSLLFLFVKVNKLSKLIMKLDLLQLLPIHRRLTIIKNIILFQHLLKRQKPILILINFIKKIFNISPNSTIIFRMQPIN